MLDVSAWPSVRLGDLCTVVRGGSPRPAGDPRFFGGSFIPWLTVAAITNVSSSKLVITETVGHLTEAGSRRSRRFRPGTVVIANSGWKCGVAKILGFECCGNDGVAGLENLTGADPRFITYWINSQTEQLRARSAAGNEQPNLNTDRIAGLAVPCPPLEEQEAIAEALSDADALIEGLERLIAKKRLIKQGAMQDLLTAKRRLPGFSGEWSTLSLNDLLLRTTGGGTPSRSISEYWDGDIPWMTVKDFTVGSRHGTLETITEQGLKNSASASIPAGTLILCTRMAVGKTTIMDVEVAINQDLKALFFSDECIPRFYQLMFELRQREIEESAGGSTVKGISLKDIRAIEMPKPCKDEQMKIAKVFDDMDAEIQALDTRLEKARQVKEGMMQNLLTGRIRLV